MPFVEVEIEEPFNQFGETNLVDSDSAFHAGMHFMLEGDFVVKNIVVFATFAVGLRPWLHRVGNAVAGKRLPKFFSRPPIFGTNFVWKRNARVTIRVLDVITRRGSLSVRTIQLGSQDTTQH